MKLNDIRQSLLDIASYSNGSYHATNNTAFAQINDYLCKIIHKIDEYERLVEICKQSEEKYLPNQDEQESLPYKDIPLEDMYLDVRIMNCVRNEIIYNLEQFNQYKDDAVIMLSDVMAIDLWTWRKVPNLGHISIAKLYWRCHELGAIFDTSKLPYTLRKFILEQKEDV